MGGVKRTAGVAALAFAAMLSIVPSAAADTTIKGEGAHTELSMTIGPDGRFKSGDFTWTAFCRHTKATLTTTTHAQPRAVLPVGSFDLVGRYRFRIHSFRFRVKIVLQGNEEPPGQLASFGETRWNGSLTAKVAVTHHGRHFDHCRRSRSSWSAMGFLAPPSTQITGSLNMTSDSGDYIGGGGSYSYTTPPDQMRLNGDASRITVETGDWYLVFEAPPGQQLAGGRTYANAERFAGNGKPGMEISGHGRGCNTLTGQFTVSSIAFDHYGRLLSGDISFEQHCEGGPAALHGRVVFARPES